MYRRFAGLVLGLWLTVPQTGSAEQTLPAPGANGWKPIAFRVVDRETVYDVVEVDGRPAYRAESACSASGMMLELGDIDLARTPRLAWRWRVDRAPTGADEQTRAGDDFAARVSLLYPADLARASWLERARARVARTWYGRELPGSAVDFVWTRTLAAGTRWANPFQPACAMVALQSGAPAAQGPGEWREAVVDLAAQRDATGGPPAAPAAIAIMTDSDNTCSHSLAWFADFRLLSR